MTHGHRPRCARAAWSVLTLLTGVVPCVAQDAPVPVPKPVATDRQMLRKYVW
jgi:hypothetical protein